MMRVIFAGGWRGRWEGWLRALSANAISTSLTLAGAKALRDILWLAVRVRNALRRQPPVRLPVPVISVGNITVGGTGKTPLTRWLVHRLKEHGHRPAILTPLTADADEAQEHADAGLQPVYTGRDRVAKAQQALAEGATVIVLDDGFQYRRLHRQLDIVLWDATAWLHPSNPLLREPLTALRRADVLVLSKADALDAKSQQRLREALNALAGGAKVLAAFGYAPVDVQSWRQEGSQPARTLQGQRVIIVTGTGNPFYVALTAQRLGCVVEALVCFPDHHRFTPADAELTVTMARRWDADGVLTTYKDALKLGQVWQASLPLWVMRVRLQWLWGDEALWDAVIHNLPSSSIPAISPRNSETG
jgi:tetraacyldisaccharide 4'-kinase